MVNSDAQRGVFVLQSVWVIGEQLRGKETHIICSVSVRVCVYC